MHGGEGSTYERNVPVPRDPRGPAAARPATGDRRPTNPGLLSDQAARPATAEEMRAAVRQRALQNRRNRAVGEPQRPRIANPVPQYAVSERPAEEMGVLRGMGVAVNDRLAGIERFVKESAATVADVVGAELGEFASVVGGEVVEEGEGGAEGLDGRADGGELGVGERGADAVLHRSGVRGSCAAEVRV